MESSFTIPQLPLLKDVIYSYWQVKRYNEGYIKETIIPKGTIEIIFSFETTKLQACINNQLQLIPRCFIQGYTTVPIKLCIPNTHTFFGIVLKATAVHSIFHFYPVEFCNGILDLTLVNSSFNSLWHKLGEQNNFNSRVQIFTNWLLKTSFAPNSREIAFDNFLYSYNNTQLSVTDLAKIFCYSTKQLSRKFNALTGLNTEQILLYKKYLYAMHLIHTSKNLSLTEIAYSCNFFDQSHFIKTFKQLSQLTPHLYKQYKSNVEGHVFEIVH